MGLGWSAGQGWDVIVAGLGPAGAAAAVELARAGARVLALDGRPSRPKPCGGCLSARALKDMAFLDPPEWVRAHPVDRLWLTAPGREPHHSRTANPGAFFVDRQRLDAFLRQRAAEAGAVVVAQRARGLARQGADYALAAGGQVYCAPWLIAADGAGGLVGRALARTWGLGRSGFVYAALVEERPLRPGEGRLAGLLAGSALLELGGVPGGYGWAFLRGDTLNLGLAGRAGGKGRAAGAVELGLEARYARFLARHGLGRPGPWRGAVIPCPDGGPVRLAVGRAAVAGDAAAAADPFLGEGIGQAVLSGRLAARGVIAGDLGLYAREMAATLYRDHGHARLLARLVYGAPGLFQPLARRCPGATELAWEVLRGQRGYGGIWGGVRAGILASIRAGLARRGIRNI